MKTWMCVVCGLIYEEDLSDSPDGDAGSYTAATAQVRLILPSVASGQTGAFAFQVRVVSP